MPFYSISLRKPGRVGEPKTTFNEGSLNPPSGEAIQLRVADNAYPSKLAFWADLNRLLQRARERGQPYPNFSGAFSTSTYVEGAYMDGGYVE